MSLMTLLYCHSKIYLCRCIVPAIIRSTVGVVAVSSRKYIDWMVALHRGVIFFVFQPHCVYTFYTGTLPCSPGQSQSGYPFYPSSPVTGTQTAAIRVLTRLTSSEKFCWDPFSVPVFSCSRNSPFNGLQASSMNGHTQVRSPAVWESSTNHSCTQNASRTKRQR